MHSLAYTTEMALCPFRTDVCSIFGTDRVAFVMDTGNISFSQLGLNTKFSKRLFSRRRTVCSPIIMVPFLYSDENIKDEYRNRAIELYQPETMRANSHVIDDELWNLTTFFRNTTTGYQLIATDAYNTSFASPLLQSISLSSRVMIITLINHDIAFSRPYSDPFFYVQDNRTTNASGQPVFYRMSYLINSVACQEMSEFCSNLTHRCTGWGGLSADSWDTKLDVPYILLGNQVKDSPSKAQSGRF